MVGKGVLLECLVSEHVEEVLLINRHSIQLKHPKIKELLHADFNDFSSVENQLQGYDACFYCMGISSLGMKEEDYSRITYNLTKALADILHAINPAMVFNYVSGMGTDSSEKDRVMWARVKGKTENLILNMGFKDAYAFRPGFILPEKRIKSRTKLYNIIYIITKPLFPLLRKMNSVTTTTRVGKAMINSVLFPQELKHLENSDINKLALL